MHTHIFLFWEGIWEAQGLFYHAQESPVAAQGQIKIIHTKDFWLNESTLRLQDQRQSLFTNQYQISPFRKDYTFWKAYHSAFGNLKGKFAIVGDTIISSYQAQEGNFNGTEYFQKINDDTYLHRGVSFKGEEKLSAWTLEIKMVLVKEKKI